MSISRRSTSAELSTCIYIFISYSDLCVLAHCRCRGFLLHLITLKNTIGIAPLDDGSARRKYLYLHNTQHSEDTVIHTLVGFELAVLASERPQTHALDCAAIWISQRISLRHKFPSLLVIVEPIRLRCSADLHGYGEVGLE
jgi:hypothetical protein